MFLEFLFLFVVLLVFEQNGSQYCLKALLDRSTSFCTSLLPRYGGLGLGIFSHLREWERRRWWQFSILQNLVCGRATLLLQCGDVERNPGPAAPAEKCVKKNKMLQIVHLNARSLIRHFDDIACLVSSVHPDILAVSETWLNSSVGDGEVYIPGYCLLRCDRSRCGGGVAIYFAEHLSCCNLTHGPSSSGVEYLWVSIDSRLFSSPLVIGCFYRPPSLPTQSVQDVCDSIERMMTTKRNVIACGDFNVDMTALHKPHSKLLSNFLTSHSLQQPINSPTHFSTTSQSILDLFIVTSDIKICSS